MPGFTEIGDKPVTLIASIKKYENPPILLLTDISREKMAEYHELWVKRFPKSRMIRSKTVITLCN